MMYLSDLPVGLLCPGLVGCLLYVSFILWQLQPALVAFATGKDPSGIFVHVNRTMTKVSAEQSCFDLQRAGPEITASSLALGFLGLLNRWSFIWAVVSIVLSYLFIRSALRDFRHTPVSHGNRDFLDEICNQLTALFLFFFLILLLLWMPLFVLLSVFIVTLALFPVLAKLQRFDLQNAIAICVPVPNGDVVGLSWFVLPLYLLLIAFAAKKATSFKPITVWSFLDLGTLAAMPFYTNMMTVVSLVDVSEIMTFLWALVTMAAAGVLLAGVWLAKSRRGLPLDYHEEPCFIVSCTSCRAKKLLLYRYSFLMLIKLALHDLPQALLTFAGLFLTFMPGVNQYMIYGLVTNTISCVTLVQSLRKSKDDQDRRLIEVGVRLPFVDASDLVIDDGVRPSLLYAFLDGDLETPLLQGEQENREREEAIRLGKSGKPLLEVEDRWKQQFTMDGETEKERAAWPWCQPLANDIDDQERLRDISIEEAVACCTCKFQWVTRQAGGDSQGVR